jgi:hypothetical protein
VYVNSERTKIEHPFLRRLGNKISLLWKNEFSNLSWQVHTYSMSLHAMRFKKCFWYPGPPWIRNCTSRINSSDASKLRWRGSDQIFTIQAIIQINSFWRAKRWMRCGRAHPLFFRWFRWFRWLNAECDVAERIRCSFEYFRVTRWVCEKNAQNSFFVKINTQLLLWKK